MLSRIKPLEAIEFTQAVNINLTVNFPRDWFKRLRNYVMEDRQIEELRTVGAKVEEVTAKDSETGTYYVRPGQLLRQNKFTSGRMTMPIGDIRNLFVCLNIRQIKHYSFQH